MSFITVGGQPPFDRLVHTVDRWALDQPEEQLFLEIGESPNSPPLLEWGRLSFRIEFHAKARSAYVLVAHAGMGSIPTAMELGKPIVVLPRRADLRKHRKDHQSATVAHLVDCDISVAMVEGHLASLFDRVPQLQRPAHRHGAHYCRLLTFLRGAITASAAEVCKTSQARRLLLAAAC